MTTYNLTVHPIFLDFIENELLTELEIDAEQFWSNLEELIEAVTDHEDDDSNHHQEHDDE